MSTVAKVFVVLNLVLAVAFLGAAATFLGWDDWHRKKGEETAKTLNAEITKLGGQLKEANTNLQDATRARDDAAKEKEGAQRQAQALQTAYDQIKKDYDQLNASTTSLSRALLVAQNTIKEGRTLTDQLMQERQKTMEDNKRYQDERDAALKNEATARLQLEQATVQMKDLQAKLTDTQTTLERTKFTLDAIVAQHPGIQAGANEQPMQTAKVLVADDAANVVVLSLGSEDNVKEGFKYTISRGNQYVATVEVTHVEARQSAARSLRDLQKSPPMKGDDAMTSR